MRALFMFILLLVLTLTSCEAVIHMQGYVYDNEIKKPIENAKVLLVLKRKDTLQNTYFEYDTVSYNQRMALRKTGIKDDYKLYNVGGLSKKPSPSLTDTNGYFSVGSILVPCVPKCPDCQLVFLKDGYKPLVIKPSTIVSDSMNVVLTKLTTK